MIGFVQLATKLPVWTYLSRNYGVEKNFNEEELLLFE